MSKVVYFDSLDKLTPEFKSLTTKIVTSIIMEVDSTNKFLATGDVNGIVKVWNISDYGLNVDEHDKLISHERKIFF
jgi:hypothetical protein